MDLSRVQFLSPSQDTDELFYAEATRTVETDNTFSFQGDRYETPIDLRGKEITVRYEQQRQGTVIVYDQQRLSYRLRPPTKLGAHRWTQWQIQISDAENTSDRKLRPITSHLLNATPHANF